MALMDKDAKPPESLPYTPLVIAALVLLGVLTAAVPLGNSASELARLVTAFT